MGLLSIDSAAVEALCTGFGLAATTGQTDALLRYLDLLCRWNATYNLTAVRDPAAMFTQHLADCLAVVAPLRRHVAKLPQQGATLRVLDVGSGGGLPAVVIAALMPQWSVTSVDAVGKKVAFVRQVAGALPLVNLQARHGRVEKMAGEVFDVVTSRAFASLPDFVRLTAGVLAPAGVWMAMKGRTPEQEMAELPPSIDVFHVEHLSVAGLEAERCLVWMKLRQGSQGTRLPTAR